MVQLTKIRKLTTRKRRGIVFILLAIFLVACSPKPATTFTPVSVPSETPTQPHESIIAPTSVVVPTTTPVTSAPSQTTLYVGPYVPDSLKQGIQLSNNFQFVDKPEGADLSLGLSKSLPVAHWIYALVAPFPTTMNGVTLTDIQNAWMGAGSEDFMDSPLLMEQSTLDLLTAGWGEPAPGAVEIHSGTDMLDYAWQHQPAWAIIPFENIEPKWKVLAVDGQSPLHNDFNPDEYPLAIPIGIQDKTGTSLASLPQGINLPQNNRDPSKLTVIAVTGVTAMVRGTALWMEHYGITYPAQDVGPLLRQADITHISNEIPFTPDCPPPSIPTPVPVNQPQPLISFCSSPDYIALLEEVGADLIELTGDHFADWGDEAMEYTLDLYASHNLPVYGGGMNADEARPPLLLEHNGNKIAFLGCNIGWPMRRDQIPQSALATSSHPGAAECDFEWLSNEISRLRTEGYQVIFTFQHREYDRMKAEPILVEDFGKIAGYGATVVSGSQAHQPHSMAFEYDAFIHYGLGNLFFDQYHFCADYACDYAFIDQHIFYDNRYLGVELIPIVFVDLARPRLMTEAEGAAYLENIFAASGWAPNP